nr:putative polyketide synthase (pks1) [Trichoderma aurantioeffusum]
MSQLADHGADVAGFELQDVIFDAPLQIPDNDQGVETVTQIGATQDTTGSPWWNFTVASHGGRDDFSYQTHYKGKIRLHYKVPVGSEVEQRIELKRQRLYIDAQIAKTHGYVFKAMATKDVQSNYGAKFTIAVLDSQTNEPTLIAKGVEIAYLGKSESTSQSLNDGLCWQTVGEADVDLLAPVEAREVIASRSLEWLSGEGKDFVSKSGTLSTTMSGCSTSFSGEATFLRINLWTKRNTSQKPIRATARSSSTGDGESDGKGSAWHLPEGHPACRNDAGREGSSRVLVSILNLDELKVLSGSSMVRRYVFTDILSGFLGNAATRFSQDTFIMEFEKP